MAGPQKSQVRPRRQPSSVVDVFAHFRRDNYALSVTRNPVEQWFFERLWFVAVVPPALAVVFTILAHLVSSGSDLRWPLNLYNLNWSTAQVILPAGLLMFIEALLMRRFTRSVPRAFAALADAGLLRPGKSKKQGGWQNFAARLEKELCSPWRLAFAAFFILLCLNILLQSHEWKRGLDVAQAYPLAQTWPAAVWGLNLFIVIPVLWIYFGAMGMWLLLVVARYVRWLSPAFALDIRFDHPDRCGGLKRVGSLCLDMGVMLILFGFLFSYWQLSGVLTSAVSELTTITGLGIGLTIVLALLVFFVPVWDIHNEMVEQSAARYDEGARKIGAAEQRLRKLAGQIAGGKGKKTRTAEIESLEKELDQLRKLYPPDAKYPTWPFDTSILVKFLTPQLVPLLVFIVGLNEEGGPAKLLNDLMAFISKLLGG